MLHFYELLLCLAEGQSYYIVLTSVAIRKQSLFFTFNKTHKQTQTHVYMTFSHITVTEGVQFSQKSGHVRKYVTWDSADGQENDRCNPHLVAVFVLLPVSHVHSLQLNEGARLVSDPISDGLWISGVKLQGTKTRQHSTRFDRKRDL